MTPDMNDRLEKLRELVGNQGKGDMRRMNFGYSPYMRGIYNGLEMALSTMEDREPVYKLADTRLTFEEGQGNHDTVSVSGPPEKETQGREAQSGEAGED